MYILVYVGCLECNGETVIKGVFDSREEAQKAQDYCNSLLEKYNSSNQLLIFKVEELNVVKDLEGTVLTYLDPVV